MSTFLYMDAVVHLCIFTFTRNEIVMKIEKMNMPPKPYKCRDLRPLRSIKGIEIRVIMTMTTPMPIVANFACVSVKPVVMNRLVE